jgi:hypothetical protein
MFLRYRKLFALSTGTCFEFIHLIDCSHENCQASERVLGEAWDEIDRDVLVGTGCF